MVSVLACGSLAVMYRIAKGESQLVNAIQLEAMPTHASRAQGT